MISKRIFARTDKKIEIGQDVESTAWKLLLDSVTLNNNVSYLPFMVLIFASYNQDSER